ncbi:MAG TPA: nicotinate phosphoribosyltransferase, partial [Mycobacterium sp.]|nr:nicotinate phosphoribosyltransferase [Mycobacterium sp.]
MASREYVDALFTDLYEVTMAQAYVAEGMSGMAVFETFFRKLPRTRSYVMAAGLSDVLDF